jgi:anti-sigma factor RsiW
MRRDDDHPNPETGEPVELGCASALQLVPGYLDEELSEEQAAPLRRHLLACHACREEAQAERALRRWFVPSEPVAVPEGFAARVTQLAFSGATSVPARPLPRAAPAAAALPASPRDLQRFVLRLVAVAAAVLLTFALALHWRNRPAGEELYADELPAMWSAPAAQQPQPPPVRASRKSQPRPNVDSATGSSDAPASNRTSGQ